MIFLFQDDKGGLKDFMLTHLSRLEERKELGLGPEDIELNFCSVTSSCVT